MNECEQMHPLLRGYLNDSLSARDRRMVARHLNLCASARKELDHLRSGAVKTPSPVVSANPPSEPWDLKILRWLFKTPKSPPKETETVPKKQKPAREMASLSPSDQPKKSSSVKPIIGILLFFVALAFLTHFIQNAGDNSLVKETKRWLSRHGINAFGTPSLDMVLDLTGLPQWGGPNAPVAFSYTEVISDPDRYNIYWRMLEPGLDPPVVDFSKNDLVVFFTGQKPTGGYSARFKRMENYADKTILWYDDILPSAEQMNTPPARSWVLQMVPKPAQLPALVQKIQ
ncbi:MAG TPA: hypothetical protein VK859_15970 [bacterium]|nr:hypothetical protein [bacterium]